MTKQRTVSVQTRNNWIIDVLLALSALFAALSGVYFLFFPSGGFQGGRNPFYGIVVLFTRSTWSDLHVWTGVLMILIVLVHLPLHWGWVVSMTRRVLAHLGGGKTNLNSRSQFNVAVDALIALSFLLTAISGVYLLFVPGGPALVDPYFLFSRVTWDLIHTWAGVVLIVSAGLHLAIHWQWVLKVTRRFLGGRSSAQPRRLPSTDRILT